MNIKNFIEEKGNEKISARLINELKKVPDCDEDLILAVLVYLKNDDDKIAMIKYLQKGENVNYEQVTLNALWLSQQRKSTYQAP